MTDTSTSLPPPPKGIGPAGRALWVDVTERFELDRAELLLLAEATRTADVLDQLDEIVRREGPIWPDGRPNPALVESRQQRITLARLIASLRLPDDADERPQRRGRARGTYRARRAPTLVELHGGAS